jgi:hypothetical protein
MSDFERLRSLDSANEVRILWSETAIVAIVAFAMGVYFIVS